MERPSICADSSSTPCDPNDLSKQKEMKCWCHRVLCERLTARPSRVAATSTFEATWSKVDSGLIPGPRITIGIRVEWSYTLCFPPGSRCWPRFHPWSLVTKTASHHKQPVKQRPHKHNQRPIACAQLQYVESINPSSSTASTIPAMPSSTDINARQRFRKTSSVSLASLAVSGGWCATNQ